MCWYEWDSTGSIVLEGCDKAAVESPGAQFGFSVQTGDFYVFDANGVIDDVFGPMTEVAIGAPFQGAGGRVDVVPVDDDGLLVPDSIAVLSHPGGGLAGERWGRSLGAGFAAGHIYQSVSVGSPRRAPAGTLDGSAALTREVPANPCTPVEISAAWATVDHAGNPARVHAFRDQTTNNATIVFQDDFEIHLFQNNGAGGGVWPIPTVPPTPSDFCFFQEPTGFGSGTFHEAKVTILKDTVLDLGAPWLCGSPMVPQTFTDVNAEPIVASMAALVGRPGQTINAEVIDVTVAVPSPGTLSLEFDIAKLDFGKLNLSPASCRVANGTAPQTNPVMLSVDGDLCAQN